MTTPMIQYATPHLAVVAAAAAFDPAAEASGDALSRRASSKLSKIRNDVQQQQQLP